MVISTMLFATGCSDDDDNNTSTKKDSGVKKDGQTIKIDAGSTPDDVGGIIADTNITIPDTTIKTDIFEPEHCTPPKANTINSGKIVTDCNECDESEMCFGSGSKWMCTGSCCADTTKADDDPANLCVVANSENQRAECIMVIFEDGYPGADTCMWRCGDVTIDNKTVTLTCPNDTDYSCEAIFEGSNDTYCTIKK
jgi:hypothetical protein